MDMSSKKFKKAVTRALLAIVFFVSMVLIAKFISPALAGFIFFSLFIGVFVFVISYTNPFEKDE
jgi:hypothetical protein